MRRKPKYEELKALVCLYSRKGYSFDEFLNIISYDFIISHIVGKERNKLSWDYSIQQEYVLSKRNKYGVL